MNRRRKYKNSKKTMNLIYSERLIVSIKYDTAPCERSLVEFFIYSLRTSIYVLSKEICCNTI